MDRILVVSNHAKMSIIDTVAEAQDNQTGEKFPYKCQKPVEVVWETTPRKEPTPLTGFELDFDDNYLFVSQISPRKNFNSTITWFVEEFIDQEVGLVVKTNTANNSVGDFERTEGLLKSILSKYPDRKCKIYLLHGDLTSGEMTSLYQNEKINALMFEATREGLPVITVAWSGQNDFLYVDGEPCFERVDFSIKPVQQEAVWPGVIEKESMWAFAEQGSFKMALRKNLKNKDKARERAKIAQENIQKQFSEENLNKLFVDTLLGFDSSVLETQEEEVLEFE